jgi:hypothetical protein
MHEVPTVQTIGKALAETLACARANTASVGTNPFVAHAAPAAQPRNDASVAGFRAEAAALTANLLSSAGVQGFQIMSDIPPQLASFHSVWTAPGLVGAVLVKPDSNVDQATSIITAKSARNCKGKFGVAKLPVTAAGADIKTLCETSPGKADAGSFLILPRPAGGIYVFMTSDVNDGAPASSTDASVQTASVAAEATSARLMEASIRVLGR